MPPSATSTISYFKTTLVATSAAGLFSIAFLAAACSTERSRMYDREVSAITAIRAIRTIQTAQTLYYSQFNHYAGSLKELGPPQSGNSSAQDADMLDSDLASGTNGGYNYVMVGNQTGYTIRAVPSVLDSTGSRSFYSDQTMVVHEHCGPEPATTRDPEMK